MDESFMLDGLFLLFLLPKCRQALRININQQKGRGFYGRPLLDVLMEDLMENTNVAAAPIMAVAA